MRIARLATLVALGIAASFALLEIGGARADVGLLSGTLPAHDLDAISGGMYVLAWFGFVVVAPVLIGGVILYAACGRIIVELQTWQRSPRR